MNRLTQDKLVKANIEWSKIIGNMPGNLCTPTDLANISKADLPSTVKVKVLGEKDMNKMDMGLLLGVSQGSDQEAKLIVCEYFGGKKDEDPTVIVGKGLTFDAGGYSIKPAGTLWQMRHDKLGGVAALATIKTVAEAKAKVNLVVIVPASENLINGSATKPGDVHIGMGGLSVEIRNTDAEGRLILADALSYAQAKYNPKSITTVATLTGAALHATGTTHSALLGTDKGLIAEQLKAGIKAKDLAWNLPFVEEHSEAICGGDAADLKNISSTPGAGTTTAFAFLEAFVDVDIPFTHLDVAATASSGEEVTGRPVGLLCKWLLS